jgi:hypothetical protein
VYAEAGTAQGSGALVGVTNFTTGVAFQAVAHPPAIAAGYFQGNVSVFGSLGVTGGKFAIVKSTDGEYHGMYAVESPECWFEDVGTGTVTVGKADIKFDPTFAAHVHSDDYHVFITEMGENNALHVASKSATGFSVQPDAGTVAAKGRTAAQVNTTFSYRVMARRSDIAGERFPKWEVPPHTDGMATPLPLSIHAPQKQHANPPAGSPPPAAPAAQPRPSTTGSAQAPVQPAPPSRP